MINIQGYDTMSPPDKKAAVAETDQYLDSFLLLLLFCLVLFLFYQGLMFHIWILEV